ncbi:GEVED domain-containing protein [uncultured Tenacibaculum sp.]|uniref:GEVED domain-containing protein n=1 Tax=uncultured Tenacibaculum sp. TaxID=174713 RepID=UPI00260394DD|nr:GEVED domain-containing protein [uncultured Tenacibaculum sp.]
MIKKHTLSLLLIFTFSVSSLYSQNFWNKVEPKTTSVKKEQVLNRENTPEKYSLKTLDLNSFKNYVSNVKSKNSKKTIQLPNSKGELQRFFIYETSSLAPELAAKFPMIKSYSAKGIDDPTAVAKISLGNDGFHAIIFSGNESTVYIDPYTKNKKQYIIYKREHLKSNKNDFSCQVEDSAKKIVAPSLEYKNADDGKLRTYRIAIACTGEYSQFHINNQGVAASATDAVKKAAILSAMNTTMTRVNGVYERDLGVRMVIVNDNDKLIFLDAATDGLSNSDANSLINESQQKCDAVIGNANYDVGHTFSTGGGGLAQLNSVCITGAKASGITGSSQPISDPYDIDFVAHELGHQFGGTHTQNNSCNRTSSTAVEPGSGSTIMGYAGICAPNVQGNSDDHFHAVSIAQMWNHIKGGGSCAVQTDTSNNAPTANAGSDVSIPKSTPFVLKGSATDAQGTSSLTYNWEQTDNETATMPPESINTGGPAFRSLPSKVSPNRYFPALPTVIGGSTATTWEVIPSVARTLNFALTVRDNHAGGGNSARDDIKITVTNAEAFTVTAPNSSVVWSTGTTQTITWNKGTTDQAPINCAKVNIRLSTDGGVTFPILIKENIANDGTEDIVIPNNPTAQARIMVEAADNVFYNVNSTNFTINSTVPTFLFTNKTSKQTVCNTGGASVNYTLNFDFVNGFSETVTLSATDLPNGATASFSPTTISADGDVTMTISNLNGSNQQDYTIIAKGTSASVTQTTDALLKVIGTSFSNINITSPANTATNIGLTPKFEWAADANATSYTIVVATDAGFANIIINETATTNSYTHSSPLSGVTKYYWYVKPKNDCGEGANSSTGEFTTEAPSYCSSTFTDETGGGDHITNVTFNTINNTSGNDTVDGYQDFTSKSTNIKRTLTHQISVTFNTDGYQDHCYVFIDWNQDFVFNKTTERYDLGSRTEEIATATLDITVPEGAVLGSTRMRVVLEYDSPTNNYGDGPCDSDHKTEWGETEDYTIVVEDKPQPDFTLTNTTGSLSICNKAVNEQTFAIDYKTLFGFNENVTFSVTGIPTNATSSFNPTSLNANGAVNLMLSNLNNATVGDYTMVVTGTSASVTKSINILFNVNDNICKSTGTTASQISTTLVKFGDIDNTSTKTTGYSDFKAKTTEVIKGDKYLLKTNVNTDGNNTVKTYAWIDWNQNCLFDANEKYDLGQATNTSGATSNSGLEITIPSDALTGTTTLRVSTKKADAGDPNSCELNFNGEVEDYTINITPKFILTNKTGGGSVCNKATNEFVYNINYETFNDFSENVALSVAGVPANATATLSVNSINTNNVFTLTVSNLNNVAVGDYTLKLTGASTSLTKSVDIVLSVNDNLCKSSGNTKSQISITNVKFGEIDNTSTKTTGYSDFKSTSTGVVRGENYDLTVTVNKDGNNDVKTFGWIDWNQNCLFDAGEAFDLTSNTSAIAVPEDALLGATTLRISTKLKVAPNSCELDFDGEVEDYTINIEESFATSKSLFTDLKLYPVPSEGKLTVNFKVKSKDLTIVRLFDLRGQLLETQSFSTISSSFNKEIQFKTMSSGIYLLQVENDGKIKTRKVVFK